MKKLIKAILFTLLVCCSSTLLYAQNGDRDGDGVLDKDDVCPDVAGTKENKGCPVENNKGVNASPQAPIKGNSEKKSDFSLEEFNAAAKQITPEYKKALEKNKKGSEELNKKSAGAIATLFIQDRNFKEALKAINEGIDKYPTYADNYYIRAIANKGINEYYSAFNDFEKAIKLDPSKSIYFVERGLLSFALQDAKFAIEDFDKAIKLEPNNAEYYLKRAFFKSKTSDHVGAISDYDQALLKGATSKEIFLGRGIEKSMINKTAGCNDLKVAKDAQVSGAEKVFEICGCK